LHQPLLLFCCRKLIESNHHEPVKHLRSAQQDTCVSNTVLLTEKAHLPSQWPPQAPTPPPPLPPHR
jgi:hypothetical protein